jgi:RHS repeat-associated protein
MSFHLTNMVDAAGTTKYTYTAGDQLLTEDGPFASDTVTNTYRNRLRVALSLQQPTGAWTNGFAYDAARRLTNVVSQAGSFASFYAAGVGGNSGFSSRLIQRQLLANSSAITNSFDSVARLLGTYLRTSAGVLTNKHEYLYNLASQRTNETRMDGSTVAYAYDNIGQLKAASSSVYAENRGYSYDRAWNLTNYTINSSSGTYLVNNLNELTNIAGGYSLTYDANGNRTDFGGYYNYTYDDENRLTQMSDDVYHSFLTQFVYDGLGRLRQRLEYVWTGTKWSVSATVSYLYDGWRVIQERDSNSVPTVSYTRGNDLSGSLEGAGGIGGLLARSSGYSSGNWSTNNVYHADGNGNVTFMLNSSQTMVASYRYDPFGNKISSSGSLAAANTYRFSSKEIHVNSGMYYYGYRFYDPSLQRWLNRDPLEERGFSIALRHKAFKKPRLYRRTAELSQGPNLYSFVGNNPVVRSDALGLSYDSEECAGLLNEIDFLFSLKGRTGIDANEVQRQINNLQDEYDENCGDDDGGPNEPQPVPVPVCPAKKPELCKAVVVAAGGATAGYIIYRCVRMIPSLFPPLWETIPINVAVP